MSTELKSRSPAYYLTRFSGPNGLPYLQITVQDTPQRGHFIQLSQRDAGFLISDLYDFVQSDPRK